MSSFFTVELDTTAPLVDISVTKLIQSGHSIELELSSNEALAVDQNIYITDYSGEKQKIILERVSPQLLSGFIGTDDYAEGPATLHIQVWDEVANTFVHEEPILIITDGLTYCMHDTLSYTAPMITDETNQPTVAFAYAAPTAEIIGVQPTMELIKLQPTVAIEYVAPICTVRRCHDV